MAHNNNQKPIHILFVINGLAVGGAEKQILVLAKNLQRFGYTITLLVLKQNMGLMQQDFEEAGITLYSLGLKKNIFDIWRIRKYRHLFQTINPDIIHSHMVHANSFVRTMRFLFPHVPIISSVHNIIEKGMFYHWYYKITDRHAAYTHFVSRTALSHYIEHGWVSAKRAIYIPNAIDEKQWKHEAGNAHVHNRFSWICVGSLTEQKNHQLLLQAFKQVVTHACHPSLDIIGDGPLYSTLEKQIHDLQLDKQVTLHGNCSNIKERLQTSHAFVLSSKWEGMPIVLLEAGAMSLPMVVTRVGGNAEVCSEPQKQYLVESDNVSALARAMNHVMDLSDEQRRELGLSQRNFITTHFSINAVCNQWDLVYRQLC